MAALEKASRQPVLRTDYLPPHWLVDQVEMSLNLVSDGTRVKTRLALRRNPQSADDQAVLELNGSGLETRQVAVDGREIGPDQYRIDGECMYLDIQGDQARVETEVVIHPDRNTALEGLYAAGDMLLTQCEAEGFRKITWYPDRPDVMAPFTVRLEGDRDDFPVLLSNGNCVDCGDAGSNRQFAVWEDPFPKPSYLFAVVAGRLGVLEDEFVTSSGKRVSLKLYSEPDNLPQLDWAMDSLKKAMAWDEERYGLEYDLATYHVVATHDFNMGAMENKSLNVFNARYVLADAETATDADFEAIESVIGHEYFHNWTGNRVTCRDWFQLTLKEGLTVFRDREFTADLRSPGVKRIQDVAALMARQFAEDSGPMAHPVRPERYVEINNFYTATVYEKGAEVVRMYQTLLGREGFRRGMDLYFERHDGQAVTCDDFLAAMADANDIDLEQFMRWYRQVGTPVLNAAIRHEGDHCVLTLSQALPDHPDNHEIGPLMIPVRVGFLDSDNRSLPVTFDGEPETGPDDRLLILDQEQAEFRFRDIPADSVVSLLRNFSAPVKLEYDWTAGELARLAGFDPDPFTRWRAMRRLSERVLERGLTEPQTIPDETRLLTDAWQAVLDDRQLDPALAAELLSLPSENELGLERDPVDVDSIHEARQGLLRSLVESLQSLLVERFDALTDEAPWSPDAEATARRRLSNTILGLLNRAGLESGAKRARRQYKLADNMTDRMGALRSLVFGDQSGADEVLAEFAASYGNNPLVMDKWFAVQSARPHTDTVETVRKLSNHPAFRMTNPNKISALIGTFAMNNPVAFHRCDGAGYRLLGESLNELDDLNPQVAARLAGAFNRWRAYGQQRAELMKAELEKLADKPGLSPDVEEIVTAALSAG